MDCAHGRSLEHSGSSLFSMEHGAQQNTKPQTPSPKEAPNLKLQTKV
jgi:hypothetical protein